MLLTLIRRYSKPYMPYIVAVAVFQLASTMAGVYYGSKTAMAVGRPPHRRVFRNVTSFSAKDVNTFGVPTLITRGTNDVQQVQMLVLMGLNFMVATPSCASAASSWRCARTS